MTEGVERESRGCSVLTAESERSCIQGSYVGSFVFRLLFSGAGCFEIDTRFCSRLPFSFPQHLSVDDI